MKTAAVIVLLLVCQAEGDASETSILSDYDYQSGQFLDQEEALLNDYIPVQTDQEKNFLEGLIIEAGRHVLFPKLYQEDEEKSRLYASKEEDSAVSVRVKGQPEFVENYENQARSRRVSRGCPQSCKVYKPVCGSDGKIYDSACHMRRENCRSPAVTIVQWQRCRGKHYKCPTQCVDINDPVCGSDGRIYYNICIMRKMNCGKLLDILPIQKCYEISREGAECQDDCQQTYEPVCGSDGAIYYNECFLKKKTCRTGIVRVKIDNCIQSLTCPQVCLAIYEPVCGTDGRLYINRCRMLQQNCGVDVKVAPRSSCNW